MLSKQDVNGDWITLVLVLCFVIWFLYFLFAPALKSSYHRQSDAHIHPHQNKERNFIQKYYIEELPISTSAEKKLLTVIIPAYNEMERLHGMLKETMDFLEKNVDPISKEIYRATKVSKQEDGISFTPFHILVINDGSTDDTVQSAKDFLEQHPYSYISFNILSLPKNRGKGAAVQLGMLHSYSRSHLLLMADADGATTFSSLINLLQAIKDPKSSLPIVFGSRAHMTDESKTKRSRLRTFLMQAFHFFVKTLCSSKIRDTQCGFKLFPCHTVPLLFQNLHLERWAFDTELVVIAERLEIPVEEVAVEWREVDGSKLNTGKLALLINSMCMLRDMICVKLCYCFGIWKLKTNID